MTAQTIKAQVEELIGSTSIASLDDYAGSAVDRLIMMLPYDSLFPFTSIESCTYTGSYTELTTKNKRIFEVLRAVNASSTTRTCDMISPEEYKGKYADSNSLYYPTDYDPKYTIYGDIVKVLPAVTNMVVSSRYIAITGTFDTSTTSISTLPYPAEFLVVLDVAQKVAYNKIQALTQAALTLSPTIPTAPSVPAFVYTDATVSSIVASTIGSLGSAPAYTKPTIGSLPSALSLSTLVIGVTVPTSPTLATVSYTDATGSTVSAVTFGSIPAVPTYTNITVPAGIATVLALFDTAVTADTLSVTTVNDFVLGIAVPSISAGFATALTAFDTAMTNEDIELATTQLNKATDYLKQLENDVALYNIQADARIKEYQANTGKTLEVVKTKLAINTEIPKTFLAKAGIYLNQYQIQINEALGKFNGDLKKFDADVQKLIEQSRLTEQEAQANAKLATDVSMQNKIQTMEAILKNNSSLLQKYQTESQSYQQQVSALVESYSANLQSQIAQYNANVKTIIDTYQLDIQNELNESNLAVQNYQVLLQSLIKQLDVTASEALNTAKNTTDVSIKNKENQLAKQVQEYSALLKLYEDKIGAYAQQVQGELGQHQSNLARIKAETDKYLALVNQFKQEYYEILSTEFGIQFKKGKDNGQ